MDLFLSGKMYLSCCYVTCDTLLTLANHNSFFLLCFLSVCNGVFNALYSPYPFQLKLKFVFSMFTLPRNCTNTLLPLLLSLVYNSTQHAYLLWLVPNKKELSTFCHLFPRYDKYSLPGVPFPWEKTTSAFSTLS